MSAPLKDKKYYQKQRTEVIPTPNPDNYGERFKMTELQIKAGDLLADGYSQQKTADTIGVHRNTIRNWLKVPEFTEYVDELIYDTGISTKRNRIAKMKGMFQLVEEIFVQKITELKKQGASEERLKDIVSEMRELLKQIATEKEEYVALSRSEHSGVIGIETNIEAMQKQIDMMSETERNALMKEFEMVSDVVISMAISGVAPKPTQAEEEE